MLCSRLGFGQAPLKLDITISAHIVLSDAPFCGHLIQRNPQETDIRMVLRKRPEQLCERVEGSICQDEMLKIVNDSRI